MLISAAAFALLIWWELRTPEPMVDLRLMRNPTLPSRSC